MKKQIRQVTGTQIGVTFTKEVQISRGIEVGGFADLDDVIFYKKGSKIINKIKPQYKSLIEDAIKQHEETKHE